MHQTVLVVLWPGSISMSHPACLALAVALSKLRGRESRQFFLWRHMPGFSRRGMVSTSLNNTLTAVLSASMLNSGRTPLK